MDNPQRISSASSDRPEQQSSRVQTSASNVLETIRKNQTVVTIATKVQSKFGLQSWLFSGKEKICTFSTYVIWQVITLVANSLSVYSLYMWQRSTQPYERVEERSLKGNLMATGVLADDDQCTEGMHWLARFICCYLAVCTTFFCVRVFTGYIYENDAWILTAAMVQTEQKMSRENRWRFFALMRLCFWTFLAPAANLGLTTGQINRLRDLFYEQINEEATEEDDKTDKHLEDKYWKLSDKGLETLVDLTLVKGTRWQDDKGLKEKEASILSQIINKTDASGSKIKKKNKRVSRAAEAVQQWNNLFSGRREIVESLLGLFIDDNAADKFEKELSKELNSLNQKDLIPIERQPTADGQETADELPAPETLEDNEELVKEYVKEKIKESIRKRHENDIFNALAIDDFSLHLFLGAYVRAQTNREQKKRSLRYAHMLRHWLLMPFSVMDHTQIATAHVEERCIMNLS